MALEKETLQTLNNLNRVISKLDNTVASFIGRERANSPNFSNESPNKKTAEEKVNDRIDDLAKSAENARKSLDKNIDSAAKHVSIGFSDILQRMGNSITNAFPMKMASRTIRDGLVNLENDISDGSLELKDSIRGFVQTALSENGLDTDSFLISANEVNKNFMKMNDIISDVIQGNKISKEQSEELISVMDKLKESGIDVIDVFDDADGSLENFISLLEDSNGSIKNFSEDSIKKLQDFNNNVVNSGNIFADSVLNLAKHIDDTVSKSFVNLARKVDNLGDNLLTALRVGLVPAAVMEANALSTLVQEGFRDVSLLDLGFNAADFGQSQQDFAQNLREFRTAIRLLAQSPDTMAFAGSEMFNSISEDIRDRFGIFGAQNTQFLGKQLETFAELGIRPTLEASRTLNEEIQILSGIGDKSVQEIQDIFLSLSKDKTFKAFFMSIGGGEKGLSGLSKQFIALQKQVGLNIDEFVSLQQEQAQQRGRTGSERIVQGAFAERLAQQLGFDADQTALIRQGVSFNESLTDDQRTEFQALLLQGGSRLTEAITAAAQQGEAGASTLQRLNILRGGAGIFGQERPEILARQQSGTAELFQENQELMIQNAKLETDNMTKFATAVSEFVAGIKNSPIGIGLTGIAGVFGDLGAAALGGVVTGAVLKNGLKGSILGLGKGIINNIGKSVSMGFKKIPWIAGIFSIGNGIFDAIAEEDNLSKPRAFVNGLWDGVANFVGGIPDLIFGTDISGFLSNINPFEFIGTKIGEWAAISVNAIGGWFDGIGGFFSTAFDNAGDFLSGIGETVTGWFDFLGDGISSTMEGASNLIDGITDSVGGILDDAGNFIVEGFTSGWDAITSFFGGDDETPAERIAKKERELLAKQGEEQLQETLNKLSVTMDDMVKEMKEGNEQANEHHVENKLLNKIETRKRVNSLKSFDALGQSPVG